MFGVGILCLLKYSRLMFGYCMIQFFAGCCSDRTATFTNIFKIAFSESDLIQCFTHILRKIIPGKGNGQYIPYLKYNENRSLVERDMHLLHKCITKKQFLKLSQLVGQGWIALGEIRVKQVFFQSYVDSDDYSGWWAGASPILGYHGDNNPTESFMRLVKGTKKHQGLLTAGQNPTTMLLDEFPKLIFHSSIERVGVKNGEPLLNVDYIFNTKTNIYKELIHYYESFRYESDSMEINNNLKEKQYLVNTERNLGNTITNINYLDYINALNGITNLPYQKRAQYKYKESNYCMVTQTISDGRLIFRGSCSRYKFNKYCPHTAVFQYREKLLSYGIKIPTTRNSNSKKIHRLSKQDPYTCLGTNYDHIISWLCNLNHKIHQLDETYKNTLLELISNFPNIAHFKLMASQKKEKGIHIKINRSDFTIRKLKELNEYLESKFYQQKSNAISDNDYQIISDRLNVILDLINSFIN